MRKIAVSQFNKDGVLIGTYNSLLEAAQAVRGQESHISECCRCVKRRNTHKGFIWKHS